MINSWIALLSEENTVLEEIKLDNISFEEAYSYFKNKNFFNIKTNRTFFKNFPVKEKDKYIGVGYVISNGTFTVKDGFICGECIFSENNNYEYLDCQVDISDIDGKIVKIIAIQVKECK